MLISDPHGGKVLIMTNGDINLVAEPTPHLSGARRHLRRHFPAMAVSALAVTVVSTLISVGAAEMLLGRSEARLGARVTHVADHLRAVMATADLQSERQSFRVMEHVEKIGDKVERVGEAASALAGHVDALPDVIGKAAQDSTQSVIGWLSALKPPADDIPAPAPAPGPLKKRK